jgi:3-oxosteroid 1-dehydrogenase
MYTAIYLGDFANPLIMSPVRAWLGIHGAFLAVSAVLAAGAAWAATRHVLVRRPSART